MSMVSYPHILGPHKLRETIKTFLVNSKNIDPTKCLKDYLALKESKN
jgi:hypothetical protein